MPEEKFSTTALLSILDSIAPFAMAEPWDNVGLMVGDPGQQVNGILIALDPTEALIHEALSQNLNTILTHHPQPEPTEQECIARATEINQFRDMLW